MSRRLARLLGAEEALVSDIINEFESLSGFDSRDVRLLAELNHAKRSKIAQLHLDPHDTKGGELYHALTSRLAKDIEQFGKALGFEAGQPTDDFAALKNLIEMTGVSGDIWALKSSSARKLLMQNPPKRLVKHLGYRSLQSMLKRENTDVVYLGIEAVESPAYLKKLNQAYQALGPNNFESRSVRIVSMQRSCWQNLPRADGRVISASALRGVIAVWPAGNSRANSVVVKLWLTAEAIERLRFESLMLKLHQAGGDFNRDIVRLLRRHHSTDLQQLAELFGPHLHAEDLRPFEPIELLAKLNPNFRWWTTNHHLASIFKSGPLSFNADDVLKNYIHDLPYGRRAVHHFQISLWDKLLSRYLAEPAVEEFVLSHLNSNRWQYEALPVRQSEKQISVPQPTAGIFE